MPPHRQQFPSIFRRFPQNRQRWTILLAILAVGAVVALLLRLETFAPVEGHATAIDGDTLRIGSDRVRLLGIDAPELRQSCSDANGAEWACGAAAQAALVRLLAAGDARCQPTGRDRYGRLLARCLLGGIDLGGSMVAAGLAVPEGDYAAEFHVARDASRGIWAGPFTRPAAWRRIHGEGHRTGPWGRLGDWLQGG